MASTGRGTATLNTSRGALTFAYYVVDANHLKMVGTNNLSRAGWRSFPPDRPIQQCLRFRAFRIHDCRSRFAQRQPVCGRRSVDF